MKKSGKVFSVCLWVLTIGLGVWPAGLVESKETFPNRPLTIIVGWAAGGQTDIVVRLLSKEAEKDLGVPILIDNKPGGGATLGPAALARSKPDGYTIGALSISVMSVVPFFQKVSYDTFKDFDYISGFGQYLYGVYARTDSPYKTIKDVVEFARKNPGKVNFGAMSPNVSLGLRYVEAKENLKMPFIPFQSGQENAMALVGGHIQLSIGTPDSVFQFIEKNEVRILAAISEQRWPFFPNVPTMKEQGYDIDITGGMVFGAPANTPKENLEILYRAFKKAHSDPKVKATLEKLWLYAPYRTGEEVKEILRKDVSRWKPFVEALNIKKAN
jgi:tripartite-type tricarboxylate transporter receptor subunit TctC